jgi:serine/threonine protein kinase
MSTIQDPLDGPSATLPIRPLRKDNLLKDVRNDDNHERNVPSLPINSDDTNDDANIASEQLNNKAFANNARNLTALGSLHSYTQSSLEHTTGGAEAEHSASTFAETNLASLRDRIIEIIETHHIGLDPEGKYVPNFELKKLINKDTIREALGEQAEDALVIYILEKLPKSFATLQLVFDESLKQARAQAMQVFRRCDFTDKLLGSAKLEICRCPQPSPSHPKDSGLNKSCSHLFPKSKPWNEISLDNFKSHRWAFLVPNLAHRFSRQEFDSRQLLPFKAKTESGKIISSGFSDVRCVDMLADNPLSETIEVAHKKLRSPDVKNFHIPTEWRRESDAHEQLNGIENLVMGIAAYRRKAKNPHNDTYYIITEWADGGDLDGYINKDNEPQLNSNISRSRDRVLKLLQQLCGLARAVERMHNTPTNTESPPEHKNNDALQIEHEATIITEAGIPTRPAVNIVAPPQGQTRDLMITDSSSGRQGANLAPPGLAPRNHARRASTARVWRHGDIKPQNILRFTKGNASEWLGTLKLADLGRAQQHADVTAQRTTTETERFRTRHYEPPDLSDDLRPQAHGKISRLFDTWSMGCVIFESVIWLLYGSSEIKRFQRIEHGVISPYWSKVGPGQYRVSTRACLWMEHILKYDAGQDSAIGDLMKLVKDGLLQVKLPPDSDRRTPETRINARNMREELDRIHEKASRQPEYAFSGMDRFGSYPPPSGDIPTSSPQNGTSSDHLSIPSEGHAANGPSLVGHRTRIAQENVYTDNLTDIWKYPDDHEFAVRMIAKDQIPYDDNLCDHCGNIDIAVAELVFERANLENNCEQCALCDLIVKALDRAELPDGDKVHHLERDLDCFVAYSSGGLKVKILRVCCPDPSKFNVRLFFDIAR